MIRDQELSRYLRCIVEELGGPVRSEVTSSYGQKVIDAITPGRPATLRGLRRMSVLVANFDHTPYTYMDGMGMEQYVYSSIEIVRTDN